MPSRTRRTLFEICATMKTIPSTTAPTPAVLALRPEVEARVKKSRTGIYRAIKDEGFPAPIQIGKRRVAWRLDEVDAWIAARPVGVRTCNANAPAVAA